MFTIAYNIVLTFYVLGQLQLNTQLNPIRYDGENRVDKNNSGTQCVLYTPVIFGNSQGENYVIG